MPDYSTDHQWVIAATYPVTDKQAKRAVLRHSVRVTKDDRLDVLETYCEQCRRPWEDVVGEPCEAAVSNIHLRGGPIGERKKRAHHKHNCLMLGCDPQEAPEGDIPPLSATG